MDPSIIDPYISHDVYAPAFLILLFSAFFIPYSHEAFNRQQRQDHAILLSIGSEEKIILSKIFTENTSIAVLSILSGLVIGICISIGIQYYMIHALNIADLKYSHIGRTCIVVIAWFTVLYGISIFLQLIYNQRQTIIRLLKDNKVMRMGLGGHKSLLILGIIILIGTFTYMLAFFDANHNNYFAVCYLSGAFGLTLIFFNSSVLISFLKKHCINFYLKNIFLLSDIQYRLQSSKKMISFAVCILGLAIFFQAFPFASYKIDQRDLNSYYPYDISYASIYGLNSLDNDKINQKATQENATITSNQTLEYLACNGMSIMSVEHVNNLMKKSYQVHKGDFISIYQEVRNDGRIHQYQDPQEANIRLKDGTQIRLKSKGHKEDILVGNIRALSGALTLVNAEDYDTIRDQAEACHKGLIRMINCSSLQESGDLARALQTVLYEGNMQNGDNDKEFYKVEIKYDGAIEIEQAHNFMIFLFSIMDFLLYFSVIIMLHFKFMMNFDMDKKVLRSLVKIGTTSTEISRIVQHNLYIMFIFPFMVALLASAFFGYILFNLAGVGKSFLLYSGLLGFIVFAVQLIICRVYNRYYIKKIFEFEDERAPLV